MSKALPPDIARRMHDLAAELNRHLRLYHLEDAPEISDAEYDRLFRELEALEEASGQVLPDSPTRRVGAPPAEGFAEFEHRVPMLSLDNAMGVEEIRAFDERVRRFLETERELAPEELLDLLGKTPGVELWDDRLPGPSTREPVGRDVALVGQVRREFGSSGGLLLWISADPVRIAAANAVRLAEARFPRS